MPPKKRETQNEKSNGMMYVAGINKCNQVYIKSNNHQYKGYEILNPQKPINLRTSDCLSFSAYSSHSVTIMDNEPSATIGPYTGNKRVLLNDERLNKWTKIIIEDKNQEYKPISAVCGSDYTLYLLNPPTADSTPCLAYCHEGENHGIPLFLDSGNYVPIALYGGSQLSAAITEEGAVLIIDSSVFTSDDHAPKYITLPQNEKAIQIAFLNKFVYALSSTGQVYKYNCTNLKQNVFERVKCLKEYEIVQISGTNNHIFAVTNDGVVLSHGQNNYGQLGIGQNVVLSTKFEIIKSLSDQKIVAAYAGSEHSLFQTSDGAIFACGSNSNGQLLLQEQPTKQILYEAKPTIIDSGATFCIAGEGFSCIYVSCNPPPKSPNMIIGKVLKKQSNQQAQQKPQQQPLNSNKLKEILQLQSQIREMKGIVEAKNNRIIQLRQENTSIIENIDKILLKIDQHAQKNPPKKIKKRYSFDDDDTDENKEETNDKKHLAKNSSVIHQNGSRPLLFNREELIRKKKNDKEKESKEDEEEAQEQNANNNENENNNNNSDDDDFVDNEDEANKDDDSNKNDHKTNIIQDDDEDSDVDDNEDEFENANQDTDSNKNESRTNVAQNDDDVDDNEDEFENANKEADSNINDENNDVDGNEHNNDSDDDNDDNQNAENENKDDEDENTNNNENENNDDDDENNDNINNQDVNLNEDNENEDEKERNKDTEYGIDNERNKSDDAYDVNYSSDDDNF